MNRELSRARRKTEPHRRNDRSIFREERSFKGENTGLDFYDVGKYSRQIDPTRHKPEQEPSLLVRLTGIERMPEQISFEIGVRSLADGCFKVRLAP